MLNYSNIIPIGLFATAGVVAGIFAYLLRVKRRSYLLPWTAGWCLLALHYFCVSFEPWLHYPRWLLVPDLWFLAAAALALFYSARLYSNSAPWLRPTILAAAAFAVWTAAFPLGHVGFSPGFAIAAVFWATAWVFWRQSRKEETYYDLLMAIAFFVRGAISVAGIYLAPIGTEGRATFFMLAFTQYLLTGLLMVMTVYEEEKRRVEDNVLALSNLNLSTSSFVGGEIEETLTQALDRVTSAVDVPAGAILLCRKGVGLQGAVASVGLDASFCRAAQEASAAEHLTGLASRLGLGGLIAFRDLEGDTSASLEHEEGFAAFRDVAVAHGLRTVACITLQAKDAAFGVLLLGTQTVRRFSSSELHLMLGLGQQIGRAVENNYLLQQTWRRSEELHVLNEIGRALSSLLDPDALFEKLFTEIQRLFDVSNFYIALYDPAENQLRFELEVRNGARLPKRSRPIGNHLIEYILRTRQPLLIRQQFEEETQRLGVKTQQPQGSFCGVPLIAYDRVIGVMAAHGVEERLYDEEHLELMRVLASAASIAIENARLFREQQRKSRQLALLNNISRNAITTLHPDEMLANIAEQLGQGLSFDHMGIAILDYAKKEVVIQAEAGRRRGALGLRLALGENLIGRVASSGQTCMARDLTTGAEGSPVLEDSVSAVALPILYADQLHGVLYIETATLTDFTDEELLLLHTLADLIASALHHALTFQKAQEQAITDGLTEVKTHRFFMEALSAEWKRSTRVSRPFSMALIDLDRFKFVNDLHGHPEGDIVLKRIGHLLEENCRRSDVVARYGGDEFVILMPETNVDQAQQLAEKLRLAVARDASLREKNITASFGIASFPMHGSTPQELIQVADASMYLSKHRGGNAVSTSDHCDANHEQEWKRDVLEAYLSVTLKRLFTPGPEAFEEIRGLLVQFSHSLALTEADASSLQDPADERNVPAESAQPLSVAATETITSLALAIDAKDHYTQGHSQKVAAYAVLLAERLGLPSDEVDEIRLGAMLHDIGKVGVPQVILNKNGPLNPEEWELMKRHVRFGDEILAPLGALVRIRAMVCHHHEMFDGSGYPNGLRGQDIPLGARIVAIADAFDTITSERTYKRARTSNAALAELERCAGAQFDPGLVQVFVDALRQRSHLTAEPAGVLVREQGP